jgi:hypothetical protein
MACFEPSFNISKLMFTKLAQLSSKSLLLILRGFRIRFPSLLFLKDATGLVGVVEHVVLTHLLNRVL